MFLNRLSRHGVVENRLSRHGVVGNEDKRGTQCPGEALI